MINPAFLATRMAAAAFAVFCPDWNSTTKSSFMVQKVKRRKFDVLYYGLFFSDCVKIFRIKKSDIKTREEGGDIGYSDKQHEGNVGEGQFHLTEKNLQIHLEKYFFKTLTYDELYQLLAAES